MCPLCIATSTIALVGAGSAGSLGALAAKVLYVMGKRGSDEAADIVSDPVSDQSPRHHAVAIACLGGDPFNASSGGL